MVFSFCGSNIINCVLLCQSLSPDYVVDADDAVGPRRPRVVDDGEVALDPDPAARLGQEAVVLGARLALVQHCKE